MILLTIISTMIPQKEDSSSGKVSKVNEEYRKPRMEKKRRKKERG